MLSRNDYYAFGKRHLNPEHITTSGTTNCWMFNGKEQQTTGNVGFLDYGARIYNPEFGRWFSIDPLAEKMTSWSPYAYAFNNPVRYIDPDGRNPYVAIYNLLRGAFGFGVAVTGAYAVNEASKHINATTAETIFNIIALPQPVSVATTLEKSMPAGTHPASNPGFQKGEAGRGKKHAEAQAKGHREMLDKLPGDGDYGGGGKPPQMNPNAKDAAKKAIGIGLATSALMDALDTDNKIETIKTQHQRALDHDANKFEGDPHEAMQENLRRLEEKKDEKQK